MPRCRTWEEAYNQAKPFCNTPSAKYPFLVSQNGYLGSFSAGDSNGIEWLTESEARQKVTEEKTVKENIEKEIREKKEAADLEIMIEQGDMVTVQQLLIRKDIDVIFDRLLWRAVRKEQIEILTLLFTYTNFNSKEAPSTKNFYPFLNYAIKFNKWEIAKKFLSLETININYLIEGLNISPLEAIIEQGHLIKIKELLARSDLDVNFNKPLLKAIKTGQIEIIELLLQHPNINVVVPSGVQNSFLNCAIKLKKWDIVKKLLFLPKVNVNYLIEGLNETPLEVMIEQEDIVTVQELLTKHDVDVNFSIPLLKAIEKGQMEIVALFLAHPKLKIDVKVVGSAQNVFLTGAIKLQKWEIVKNLLSLESVNINYVIKGLNISPLETMIEQGDIVTVKELLARPDLDVNFNNPLLKAIETGQTDIVDLFLQHSKINLVIPPGVQNLYLNCAIQAEKWSIVKKLLSLQQININYVIESLNKTPLEMLIEKEELDIIKVLLAQPTVDVNFNKPLLTAIETGEIEIIDLLLNHPKINLRVSDIQNPFLNRAIQVKKWDIVKKLLSAQQINVNYVIENINKTPLEVLIEQKDLEFMKILLAQLDVDVNFNYPLLKASRSGQLDIVKLLLKHPDVDVNSSKEAGGPNSLWIAAKHGFIDIVKELLLNQQIFVNYQCEQLSEQEKNSLQATGKETMSVQEVAVYYAHKEIVKMLNKYKRLHILRNSTQKEQITKSTDIAASSYAPQVAMGEEARYPLLFSLNNIGSSASSTSPSTTDLTELEQEDVRDPAPKRSKKSTSRSQG